MLISDLQEVAYFQLVAKSPIMGVITDKKSKWTVNLRNNKCLI